VESVRFGAHQANHAGQAPTKKRTGNGALQSAEIECGGLASAARGLDVILTEATALCFCKSQLTLANRLRIPKAAPSQHIGSRFNPGAEQKSCNYLVAERQKSEKGNRHNYENTYA
jgi:hypothetical protein